MNGKQMNALRAFRELWEQSEEADNEPMREGLLNAYRAWCEREGLPFESPYEYHQ